LFTFIEIIKSIYLIPLRHTKIFGSDDELPLAFRLQHQCTSESSIIKTVFYITG